ncbi:MAG: amino acid permease [Anaerolineales bacterium]|uniref:amino acid permease n=1 Tax=Candidatus Villigracilis proximus TaxID=3140683 RepID=UPI0031355EC6|nr:amino acid permease [Anaerolineales bacterium]
MADKSQAHDKQVLHKLGYAQELSRRMSGFSNFAISFSIICILAGGISAFPAAFNALGSGGAFLIWLVGGVLAMSVAVGMGQIASSFPTAGGLYHWSSHLGGKFWGWATAWFNLIGLICVVSSVDVLLYTVFFKDLLLATVLGVDVSAWGTTQQTIFLVIALGSQAILNHYFINITTKLTDLSGYVILGLTVVLIVTLFAFSSVPLDITRLWTFQNVTGDAGGGVVPFRTENVAFAFLLGLSYVCYTITGFDASAHTSEETQDAQVNVPKGMWTAVFWSWVFGLVAVAAYVLTMPDLKEAAALGWGSFFYMWSASRMPYALSLFLAIGMVLVNYICALAGLTSTSRMMYAFARDGGLPASEALAKVSTVYRTPGTAVWVSAIFAFASTLYAPAYLILAVACAVFLYISMVMPIAAGLIAEGSAKWKEKGPFNLGGLSKPNAFLAIIFGIVLAISGFFPPNEKVFYFTVVFVVALFGFWSKKTAPMGIGFAVVGLLLGFLPISDENVLHFLIPDLTTSTIAIGVAVVAAVITFMTGGEDQRFEGVPEGDKIKQRQKMIADIEKKYGEQ